jgi:hypothetical protein
MKIDKSILEKVLSIPALGRNEYMRLFDITDNEARVYVAIRKNMESIVPIIERVEAPKSEVRNVLVIGDLHAPFTLEGYLEFCQSVYYKYNCNEVVFTGDIIDNHYTSYHEADPDGHSAGEELKRAIDDIQKWYRAFPVAKVCLGNHCIIPNRKAMTAGISKKWIKTVGEVVDTPNWEYSEDFIIDDVLYTHGTGRKARARAKNDLISVVQGHYHAEGYVEQMEGRNYTIFAMQVGCGVDKDAYDMAYGRHFNKQHISCGVVLNNGTLPILEYMNL